MSLLEGFIARYFSCDVTFHDRLGSLFGALEKENGFDVLQQQDDLDRLFGPYWRT